MSFEPRDYLRHIMVESDYRLARSASFLHVTSVRHIGRYRLEVAFNDGNLKEIDLSDELYGEVFEPLKGVEFFNQVFVNRETNTVEWPNGADFAPEYLHEQGQEVSRTA